MDTNQEVIEVQPEELLTEDELVNVVGGGANNPGTDPKHGEAPSIATITHSISEVVDALSIQR